jgi:hypothetical protein
MAVLVSNFSVQLPEHCTSGSRTEYVAAYLSNPCHSQSHATVHLLNMVCWRTVSLLSAIHRQVLCLKLHAYTPANARSASLLASPRGGCLPACLSASVVSVFARFPVTCLSWHCFCFLASINHYLPAAVSPCVTLWHHCCCWYRRRLVHVPMTCAAPPSHVATTCNVSGFCKRDHMTHPQSHDDTAAVQHLSE